MLSSNTSAVSGDTTYVEDVFSTYLYNGNSSTQTITNGIDLSTKGGLVWQKSRSNGTYSHRLTDTVRGAGYGLSSDSTNASTSSSSSDVTGFTSSGFNLGYIIGDTNLSGQTYTSWTFRKQPKFFDCGTYTGTGAAHAINHNLGSVPGVVIVKELNDATNRGWVVYHRSLGATKWLGLNTTDPVDTWSVIWNNTDPTSTQFTVGTGQLVNNTGVSYVYYVFAHDAGGFGLTGTDNVISCGSYTGNGSTTGPIVTLGYEPQWLLIKNARHLNS